MIYVSKKIQLVFISGENTFEYTKESKQRQSLEKRTMSAFHNMAD